MRITIDERAADEQEALPWLNRILNRVEDGWHLWDVTGLEQYQESALFNDEGVVGRQARELFPKAVSRSAYPSAPHGRRVRVTLTPTGNDDLAPEPAFRLADEPLVILVENRESDGTFLCRVLQELSPPLWRWWNKFTRPARFDSVGGKGQMANEVERQGRRTPKPRFAVMVDSDRTAPADEPPREARRLNTACTANGFPCWILAKRESENYLPRELLERRPDAGQEHSRRIDAWERLSEDQKDFYDMKGGLRDCPGEAEEMLFENLPASDRELLASGFGPNIGVCWDQYFGQTAVAIQRRGRGDLERGLELIQQEV